MRTSQKVVILNSGGGAAPITYLLRDDFTDTLAAGSVDGTDATPGPGTRYVKGSFISTDGASLVIDGTGILGDGYAEDDGAGTQLSHPRSAGLAIVARVTSQATPANLRIGWTDALQTSGAFQRTHPWHGVDLQTSATVISIRNEFAILDNLYPMSEAFTLIAVLRSSGAALFADQGSGVDLIGLDTVGNYATAYARIAAHGTIDVTLDYFRVVDLEWLPTPLASDGAFGATTDGLGHAEGILGGLGAGGAGLALTDNKGTWLGDSASALSGGEAISTVDVGNADVTVALDITRTGGNASIMLRYDDDNNYLRCGTDGTSMLLVEKVSGSENTLLTTAIPYGAGNTLRIRLEGQVARVYYNLNFESTTSSIDASLTGTKIGRYTTDTGNSFDNLVAYASTGYTELDQYVS